MSKEKKKYEVKDFPSSAPKPVMPLIEQSAVITPGIKKDICLVMIVKNEAEVIKKCIDSVSGIINYWVIVDTGSTDGTQELIKEIMASYNIPGELHERAWVDFGTNRTQSLQLSKGKCDYRLIIDADDVLSISKEGAFNNLTCDSYKIMIKLADLSYYRTQLVKSDQDWKYVGVLHEYIAGEEGRVNTEETLKGVEMLAATSGDRREITGNNRYYNDALTFEKALLTTPKDQLTQDLERRYTFYLAQSYRDARMNERSLENYQKRVALGGWEEEVYQSLYMIAKIKTAMGKPEAEIIDAYLRAWESRPIRLEAVYHLIRFLNSKGRHFLSYVLGATALRVGPCQDILFLEEDIWKWRFVDEYSVSCYYSSRFKEAHDLCKKLIDSKIYIDLPIAEKDRIQKNFKSYEEALIKTKPKAE